VCECTDKDKAHAAVWQVEGMFTARLMKRLIAHIRHPSLLWQYRGDVQYVSAQLSGASMTGCMLSAGQQLLLSPARNRMWETELARRRHSTERRLSRE
jgi:hypothetical protein